MYECCIEGMNFEEFFDGEQVCIIIFLFTLFVSLGDYISRGKGYE